MPHASITASFSCAVPLPPEIMAPAWPIRLPGGAVTPAMKPTTGFFMWSLTHSAAASSSPPPISPIITTASVSGSSLNSRNTSTCFKHVDVLRLFNDDPETDAVVMIGEIGGGDEEAAAEWVKDHMKKPVVGFIAGVTAPPGKRMGHAGAIISGGKGTAQEKLAVMEASGIKVTRNPAEMGKLLKSVVA